jgi:hypothetical protein
MNRGRSIVAMAAGFFVTALLSLGTDVAMHASGVFPPWLEPMSGELFGLATVYRIVFTVLGGYVTAALAPGQPMRHVMVLGAIGTVVAAIGAAATWNVGPALGPKWYPVMLVVTALPSVWLGGILRLRRSLQLSGARPGRTGVWRRLE